MTCEPWRSGSIRTGRAWSGPLRLLAIVSCLLAAPVAASDLPPSSYDILSQRDLDTPVLDAVPYCVPQGLDPALEPALEQATAGEWEQATALLRDWGRGLDQVGPELVIFEAVLFARAAVEREELLVAEERLRSLLRHGALVDHRLCGRLELARVLMHLSRYSEAAAQLTRAEQQIDDTGDEGGHAEEIAFDRAEILYRTNRRFEAHLAFRKLARSENARLALAARLRLTDLSFEAGKVESVLLEYETLLPRAAAFGASTAGWALRASEAAVDAGDPGRALRWLERFFDGAPERDLRDAAEVRMADLDVVFEDPMGARKRLSTISGRRQDDPIGALATIRAVDLGVATGSPDQQLELLLLTIRDQRDGVRRYALGVLMRQLAHRGDLAGALAVATRLAYDGVDPVVTPDYTHELDGLLDALVARSEGPDACRELVRGLGGRYGILIERASRPGPFARVGDCFERMELPWLAAKVYRTIARRFGPVGAEAVALPLARSSLAIGEITLARRVATAALEDAEGEEASAWRAIVAQADFAEGRFAEAASGLRAVLAEPVLARRRGELARLLAQTLEQTGSTEDARFLAYQVGDWLATDDLAPQGRAGLIEATLLTAHALREVERGREALPLYRLVDREAEPGALRSSARFWLGLAGEPDAAGEVAWGQDPESTLGSPWARYAQFERRFGALRAAYSGGER